MFGLLLRSEILQGSALRTWNCVLNITNFLRYKFTNFAQPVMPRSRRRHHSRSRSRSHSHDRDREVKRRRVDTPDNSHHRRSVSKEKEVSPQKILKEEVCRQEILKEVSSQEILKEVTPQKSLKEVTPQKSLTLSQQKKHEEKMKLKLEREEQRRKEKEERLEQKRKEKEEKEEQRRKEREEKEEQKRKEREEKEEQKRKEREEKEEQKRKEREEKEDQKRKEREEKELKKQQELDEKTKEKRKKEELKEKEKVAFANFFRKSVNSSDLKKIEPAPPTLAFMPFAIKPDMRLAPTNRSVLTEDQKDALMEKITSQLETKLYLDELKSGKEMGSSGRTWPIDDTDVMILEDLDIGERFDEQSKVKRMRAKFLKFQENRRPAYFGTWHKKTKLIKPRKPFMLDKTYFDYEVDSDDDWEEEEPGESLHGSDDEEKENDPDDYEVDNDFFVPHGYLSDEEIEAEEKAEISPETQKEKLKILQMEFDEEMKSKTERIKPRLIGCIWEDKLIPKVQNAICKFLSDRAIIVTEKIQIHKREILAPVVKSGTKQLDKEIIPDFLQLIHGNTNNKNLVVNEFQNYLSANKSLSYSKSFLCSQLKHFAKWKKCPDSGPMKNKFCWYVDEDIRSLYNVCLELPNKWVYTANGDVNAKKSLVF